MSDTPGSGSESDHKRPSPPGADTGGRPASSDQGSSGAASPSDPSDPVGSRRSRRRDQAQDASPPDADGPPSEAAAEPTPITQHLGRIFIVVLAVLFGVFAVANSQPVDFSWVFGETQVRDDPTGAGEIGGVPLIVLLLVTFALGALIGAFTAWQLSRSRKRRSDAG